MYSNLARYDPNKKPPLGALLNPYLSINQGLVCCWPFNEGAGDNVSDLTGNRLAGTFSGDVSWLPGQFGGCPYLDGDADFIDAPLPAGITNELTIVIWFKTDKSLSGATAVIMRLADTLLYLTYNKLRFLPDVDGSPNLLEYIHGFVVGRWYQAAVTISGNTGVLYVNGLQVDAGATTTMDLVSAHNIVMGDYNRTGFWDWEGQLDTPMIYNRALSAPEIALLYQEPFCGFRWLPIEQLAAYVAEAPPEIQALFMDLSTQIWTVKHSTGVFAKL